MLICTCVYCALNNAWREISSRYQGLEVSTFSSTQQLFMRSNTFGALSSNVFTFAKLVYTGLTYKHS